MAAQNAPRYRNNLGGGARRPHRQPAGAELVRPCDRRCGVQPHDAAGADHAATWRSPTRSWPIAAACRGSWCGRKDSRFPIAYSFSFGTPSVDSPSARAFRKAAHRPPQARQSGPHLSSSHVDRVAADARPHPRQPDAAGAAGPGRRRAGETRGVRQRESAVERDPGVRRAPGRNGRHESRHHHGDADLSAADVRAAARSLAGAAAARARRRAGPTRVLGLETNRRFVESLHGRPQCRDGARAVVARLSDRPARHLFRSFLGRRRRHQAAAYVGRPGARPMRPARRRARISSCCCAARCCGAIPMRSSISRAAQ